MKKLSNEFKFEALKTIVAILISLTISFITLLIVSEEPIYSFQLLLAGPLLSIRNFGNVLELAIPLGFAGIATSLLFRSGLFNLGAEGIFYFCGIVTTIIATKVMPAGIHPVVAILCSGICGGLIACIPGYFKAKYDTNELVTSIMLNTILYGFGFYILKTVLKDPSSMGITSLPFEETAKLPTILPGTRLSVGFIILIVVMILVLLLLNKTKFGYMIRMTGYNKQFAKYSGISIFLVTIGVHFISGFIAGIGSSIELLGMYGRFSWSKLPGYGFDGALIAMLGRNHPVGSVVAAIGLSYLRTGSVIMARNTDVPIEMICVVEISLVLLITADFILKKYHQKQLMKEANLNG